MQPGGPSPAPVQRAPRSPAPAGRDDAQAARERSVSPRYTRTAPAPPQGVPSRKASFASGILVGTYTPVAAEGEKVAFTKEAVRAGLHRYRGRWAAVNSISQTLRLIEKDG